LRCYLTLAATAQFDALEETMRSFAAMVPAGAIITKVDESTSLGGVLSVLASHHLPVAYVSEGQRVPEDLRPARSHALVSRAVSLVAETRRKLSGSAGHHVYHKVSNHG
jgi:flagellar biosynthesis protein FlhF